MTPTGSRARVKSTPRRAVSAARPTKSREIATLPPVLSPVIAALSTEDGVSIEAGWGSSSVVFKLERKMFALLVGDELVVKIPKPRVDELVDAAVGRRFDPRRDGRLMKEWLVLSPARSSHWVELAREALGAAGKKAKR